MKETGRMIRPSRRRIIEKSPGMRKASLPYAIALLALLASFGSAESTIIRFVCGSEVELDAPALQPGGILLAKLVQPAAAEKVVLRLEDAVFELRAAENGGGSFALIGLDLALRPGTHDLKMTAHLRDGRLEERTHPLIILERQFPIRELKVRQEFVTPPPEVEERIRWEAELLQMVYSVSSDKWLGEGGFERPHPGQGAGNFGERRIYNGVPRSSHSGLDIAAPLGSPVRASNSGRVALARDLYFSGKTAILDHGLGVFTMYCHFSKLLVNRGDYVKKGDVVALAGSTGRSTGPHLHWAVRVQGSRIDPEEILRLVLPE